MFDFNTVSLIGILLLALSAVPLTFRQAGYPWSQVIFGSITVLIAALAVWGLIFKIQVKAELTEVPLGWLVVIVGAGLLYLARKRYVK